MLGVLGDIEIEEFLRSENTGRIGCHAGGITYVVPVTYVFENDYVYGHSKEGRKIRMMRANPEVCFEVDRVAAVNDWTSVISWGRYEELGGDEALSAMELLMSRLVHGSTAREKHPSYPVRSAEARRPDPEGLWIVLYRISIPRRRGRFERPGPEPISIE